MVTAAPVPKTLGDRAPGDQSGTPGDVAPKIIRQRAAWLPADVAIDSTQTVQVHVEIDASGRVTKASPTDRNVRTFKLLDAALTAARFWAFEPARINGQAVPSEMLLNFRFEPHKTN
jgi:TonB family protein